MSKKKEINIRTCVGCRVKKNKSEFIRIVRTAELDDKDNKIIKIQEEKHLDGRGVYLCRDIKCLKATRKANKLSRSLACRVGKEVYEQLETIILNSENSQKIN